MIRVDIMVQADGHLEKYGTGESSHYNYEMHFSKKRKIERCNKLLDAAGISYKEHVNPKDSTTTIKFQLLESVGINKDLTKYYLANTHQLKIVTEECLLWDGYVGYRSYYSNTDRLAADVIQFAFSATGVRAGIHIKEFPDKPKYSTSYQVIPTKNPTCGYTEVPKKVTSEDGFKYCFTTNTGYFIARRGNNIFITGNCGVHVAELSSDLDHQKTQETIEKYVPYGREVHEKGWFGGNIPKVILERYQYIRDRLPELRCFRYLKDSRRLGLALGSLGGGEVKNDCLQSIVKDTHCKTRPYREKL